MPPAPYVVPLGAGRRVTSAPIWISGRITRYSENGLDSRLQDDRSQDVALWEECKIVVASSRRLRDNLGYREWLSVINW
jgi:hypothetical protein